MQTSFKEYKSPFKFIFVLCILANNLARSFCSEGLLIASSGLVGYDGYVWDALLVLKYMNNETFFSPLEKSVFNF